MFDQSDRMLTEGRVKAHRLGIVDRCAFVQGDFFAHEFDQAAYNTVLVGFLWVRRKLASLLDEAFHPCRD